MKGRTPQPLTFESRHRDSESSHRPRCTRRFQALRGFSLIELIGVLAIMAILASVLAPNVFHALDNAAVKAEADSLDNLSTQTKLFLSKKSYLPGNGPAPVQAWNVDLSTYSDLPSADILTNRRQVARVYVVDPAGGQRVMILSSMRPLLTLPSAATVQANFNGIWNTPQYTVPPGFPAVWSTPPAQATTNLGYLVIERINVQQVFATELQSFSVTINNSVTTPPLTSVSYIFTPSGSPAQPRVIIAPNSSSTIAVVKPKDRLDLYPTTVSVVPSYTQIFNSGDTNPTTFSWVAPVPQTIPATAACWRPQ